MTVCSLATLTTKHSIICLYMVLYYDERRTTKTTDIIKQRPLRRRQNKKTPDNHPRMLVSLTYTYAQDSLGNVITRTTIVILQLSLNQPLPAFAYCGRASLFCIIGITCVFVACLPVINFSSVQVPTTGPTIQLYIACTNRIACKAKESSFIL